MENKIKTFYDAIDRKFFEQFQFHITDTNFKKIAAYIYKPKDASSLAVTRILFGIAMLFDIPDERGGAVMMERWGNPLTCHFPLLPFLEPLPMPQMTIMYNGLWFGALGIALGFKYHLCAVTFTISYWYLLLADKSYWNNHSYLFGLVALLLTFTRANCYWSVDAILEPSVSSQTVPYWNYFILKYQFFILYFMAGVKKGTAEWLSGYSVLNLSEHWVFTPIRLFLTVPQTDYLIVHWFVFAFDLTVAFWMMWSRSRHIAMIFCALFHLMNIRLFRIGMFPWVCLATMPLFYPFHWPKLAITYLNDVYYESKSRILEWSFLIKNGRFTKNDEVDVDVKNDEVDVDVKNDEVDVDVKNDEVDVDVKNDEVDVDVKNDEVDVDVKNDEVDVDVKNDEVDVDVKNDEVDVDVKNDEVDVDVKNYEVDVDVKNDEDVDVKNDEVDVDVKNDEVYVDVKNDEVDVDVKNDMEVENIATEPSGCSSGELDDQIAAGNDESDVTDKDNDDDVTETEISAPETADKEINERQKILTCTLIGFYLITQAFLPFSHFITKGYNNWTNGLYGYSWDMMVHTWDLHSVVVTLVDNVNKTEFYVDPYHFTGNDRWTRHGDMVHQYARCLKDNISKEKRGCKCDDTLQYQPENMSIYIDVWSSLNGRFTQRMFDPKVDILNASWSPFTPVSYLMPLIDEGLEWRERLLNLREAVHSWNNRSDVVFIADFPGYEYEKYIPMELKNVTLTVLKGIVVYEPEEVSDRITKSYQLRIGNQMKLPSGIFHKVINVGKKPAFYMYTFYNSTAAVNEDRKTAPKLPLLAELSRRFKNMARFAKNIFTNCYKLFLNISKFQ